jgi:hypothetical protein
MYHIHFFHSSVDGHLVFFHFLDTVTSSAINMGVQMSFQHTDLISFVYMPVVRLLDHIVFLFFKFFHEPPYFFP